MFSFSSCELTAEALSPRAGHTGCVAVCSPMCKFTYTFPTFAYYSDNNEPSPFPQSPISESSAPARARFCLSCPHERPAELPSREEWGPCHEPPPKGSCWGAEAARSLFLPFFPSPCRRQPGLPRCWAAVTGSPRCSLLWTLVFLGTALPETLENRKQLKALLASFLASAPPFLS